ncbi:hypothetical protein GT037_009542 [Alternaria burnsii]|uniref:Uncharacterized protein n=1 Tax=Alternaria burnsii TaxID=1187904 RepID=A0A8H7ECF9_9PLEO|nr:uncharacterized protein GT037_009542 [Alternaria burnsii]KAF7672511.1 hypothetical protein GT037_009542 [Alternaria burnsii]
MWRTESAQYGVAEETGLTANSAGQQTSATAVMRASIYDVEKSLIMSNQKWMRH